MADQNETAKKPYRVETLSKDVRGDWVLIYEVEEDKIEWVKGFVERFNEINKPHHEIRVVPND